MIAENRKYILKLKRRFIKLENLSYSEISKNELNEMNDIRKELIKYGYGSWHL